MSRTDPASPFRSRLAGFPIIPCRPASVQGGHGAPNFAARNERVSAPVMIRARQNRHPRAPLRGACGVLDPAQSGMAPASRLLRRKENAMITLYDHIQELRAELRCCYFTRAERAAVQAELAEALVNSIPASSARRHTVAKLTPSFRATREACASASKAAIISSLISAVIFLARSIVLWRIINFRTLNSGII
jgi:hypothetical protein